MVRDAGVVQRRLHRNDGRLRRLEHRVEAAEHRHGQDHITIFPTDVQVTEDVVRNAPDVVRDPAELSVMHFVGRSALAVIRARKAGKKTGYIPGKHVPGPAHVPGER